MFREATETEGRAEDVVRDRAGLLLRCLSTDEKVKYFYFLSQMQYFYRYPLI